LLFLRSISPDYDPSSLDALSLASCSPHTHGARGFARPPFSLWQEQGQPYMSGTMSASS
jgi:hypothetical protein